jgi:hypothetical protein
MNIVKNIYQYNEDYVYFCEPIKNNIMNNGNFIRIIYSTSFFILNGIYISIQINYTSVDKYYNKFKCSFDANQYKELIEKGYKIDYKEVKKQIMKRDEIDSQRKYAPLTKAEDAVLIDSTEKTIEEVENEILKIIKRYKESRKKIN